MVMMGMGHYRGGGVGRIKGFVSLASASLRSSRGGPLALLSEPTAPSPFMRPRNHPHSSGEWPREKWVG